MYADHRPKFARLQCEASSSTLQPTRSRQYEKSSPDWNLAARQWAHPPPSLMRTIRNTYDNLAVNEPSSQIASGIFTLKPIKDQ